MINLKKPTDLIYRINKAKKPEDILSVSNFREEYKNILKQIHPDICNYRGAMEAAMQMNAWKDFLENGKEYEDDCGFYKTNNYWVEFLSSDTSLNRSLEVFKKLSSYTSVQDQHFKKYLPQQLSGKRFIFANRAIPLSGKILEQEHVNWILNRLLEYCAYLEEKNWVHAGLTPESVFIVPETHGIQICSFYHTTGTTNRLRSISGKYQHWYPASVFSDKLAFHDIDIEMVKKIAAYLLGSPSGSAVPLRATHNKAFVEFMITHHDNAHEALFTYKKLLSKNFKTKFYSLTI